MRPRSTVTVADEKAIRRAISDREEAERREREVILAAHLERAASLRELSALTGYSTTTIQRWKRDAT